MAEPERKNYTSIPNMVFKVGLSPLAILLYVHFAHLDYLKHRRPDSVRVLMDLYKASSRSIAAAKKELVDHGFISIESRKAKGLPDVVNVKDIWKRNLLFHKDDMPLPESPEQQVTNLIPQGDANVFPEQQIDEIALPQSDSKKKNSLEEVMKEIIPEWTEIKKEIRAELSEQVFNTWFPQLHAANIDSNILTLTANEQTVDWVTKYYSELIRGKAERHGIQDIRFEVNNER